MTTTTLPRPTSLPTGEQRVPRPLTDAERLVVVRTKIKKRREELARIAKKDAIRLADDRPATPKALHRLAARKTTTSHGNRPTVVVASPDNNGFDKERTPGQPNSEQAINRMRQGWQKWGTTPNPAGPPAHATHRGMAVAGSSGDSNSSSGGN